MLKEADEWLYLINLKNSKDTNISDGLDETSWEEFKESLLWHRIREKKDGAAFIPVMTKLEREWQLVYPKNQDTPPHFRGDVNMEALTSLVIDLDKPGALETAETIFAGYEYIIYSTHNFTAETPYKFRMVVRLIEPIAMENWPMCFESLKSRIELDPVCRNPSRCYFYPSHSPNSNIAPKAYHVPGKAIGIDEILGFASDKEAISNPNSFRYKQLPASARVRSRRHFSGMVVGQYDNVGDEIDVSMEAMSERHSKSLQSYEIGGSNHNFALEVTGREIALYGPKVDIKSLILFVYKAASVGGKGIETGNTGSEIPGMIVTGMMKYAPEALDKIMADIDGDINRYLSSLVRWASLNYKDAPMNRADLERAKAKTNGASDFYTVLRARHTPFIVEYVTSGDFRKLLKQVLVMELRVSSPKYAEVAKALVNYQFGYLTKIAKKSDDAAWATIFADLPLITRFFSEKNIQADAQKLTYAKGALVIECNQRIPEAIKRQAKQECLALG